MEKTLKVERIGGSVLNFRHRNVKTVCSIKGLVWSVSEIWLSCHIFQSNYTNVKILKKGTPERHPLL